MEAINVFGAWHYRFIKFTNGEEYLWRNDMNTCSYVRLFIARALLFALLMVMALIVPYTFVQMTVTLVIFFTYGTWSTQLFWDALGSLPPGIAIVAFLECLVLSVSAFLLAVVGVIAAWFKVKSLFSAAKSNGNIPVLSAIMASSSVQIVSAWHNKICRPIKVEN